MSNLFNKRNTSPGVSAEVAALKSQLAELQGRVERMENKAFDADQTLAGLVRVVGYDAVKSAVTEIGIEKMRHRYDRSKALVEYGVKNGFVNACEAINQASVMEIKESFEDDSEIEGVFPLACESFDSPAFDDELRKKFFGLKVGDSFVLSRPNTQSHKVTILGIWEMDMAAQEKFLKSRSEAQAAAQTPQPVPEVPTPSIEGETAAQ